MAIKIFTLHKHWLDSNGREHKVKVKTGTIPELNKWAKARHLKFVKDSSLFGGYYLGPSDEWYQGDVVTGLKTKLPLAKVDNKGYWCYTCNRYHKRSSAIGKSHSKDPKHFLLKKKSYRR